MKSVKKELVYSYIINKSEFISVIKYLDNSDDVESIMNDIKDRWKDATHYCYAYILPNAKKSSDDKEPQGTAGMPILDVLEKAELVNVIAVVIRYFGGIKLGVGGLSRAYRKAVSDNVANNSEFIGEIVDGYELLVEVPYKSQSIFEYKYKNIISKEFKDNIIYKIDATLEEKESIDGSYTIISQKEKKIII